MKHWSPALPLACVLLAACNPSVNLAQVRQTVAPSTGPANPAPSASASAGPIIKLQGVVTTLAGSGTQGYQDGAANQAQFYLPMGVALDAAGNVYVADYSNSRIREISTDGTVATLAGDGTVGFGDGPAGSARFNFPLSVAVTSDAVYVADSLNNALRRIVSGGVYHWGGSNTAGFADGNVSSSKFTEPEGVAADSSGNLLIADTGNYRIRKITAYPDGSVLTLAGGTRGSADGIGSAAQFSDPIAITVDASGAIYVGDSFCIRKVTPQGVVTTIAGVPGFGGHQDGPANTALFGNPSGLAAAPDGTLYVADQDQRASYIRQLSHGVVSTLAGGPNGFADGQGGAARFNLPWQLALDASGSLYVADSGNNRIRVMH